MRKHGKYQVFLTFIFLRTIGKQWQWIWNDGMSLPRLFRCFSMLCWYNISFVTTDYSLIFMHFSIYPSLGECDLFPTMHICVVRPCWFKYYCSFFIWYIISVWFSVFFIFCDIFFFLCWEIPKKYDTYISATSLLCTRMLVVYKL